MQLDPPRLALAITIVAVGFLSPWLAGDVAPAPPSFSVEAPPLREARIIVLPQLDLHPESEPAIEQPPEVQEVTASREVAPASAGPEGPEAPLRMDLDPGLTAPGGVRIGIGVASRGVGGDGGEGGAAVDRRSAQRQKARSRAAKSCLPEREDIAQVGEQAFRIEDSLVYYYANHPVEAEDLAATWWSTDDEDEIRGFKLGRMQCGSILRQAGLENGDVISTVNGMEIRTYADGVMAFLKLRTHRILWIEVIRKGEVVRLDYVLVDDGQAKVELDDEDPLADPSALVDQELALAELPWLQRTIGKRKLKRATR